MRGGQGSANQQRPHTERPLQFDDDDEKINFISCYFTFSKKSSAFENV